MKTKLKFLVASIIIGFFTTQTYAQTDSLNVSDILNNVLAKQKKEIEKKGLEEKRIQDSIKKEMDTYLSKIEAEERRTADSILFLETKALIQSEMIERNKNIESLKDSTEKIKIFLLSDVPNWYTDYGVKSQISKLLKKKIKEIENNEYSINMTEESYPNDGRFFNLSSDKESELIAANNNLNKVKKEELKKGKLLNTFNREKEKQQQLFEGFKGQYKKLNPKINDAKKAEIAKNLNRYKNVVSSIKSLEHDIKTNGRLTKMDPSVRRQIKNIFRKVDWEYKAPIGNNEILIKTALEQAKTLASKVE